MKSKSLLIVESPAKVRTLSKFLGKDFNVRASIGHVKDLPTKELGVDLENDFKPEYVVIEGKEKVLRELKKAAKSAERVFLGPDPDREGEAIAWHIAEELNGGSDKIYRVVFNEITEKAVREAIKNPRKIDSSLFDAQQARRVLDRLVGYKLSPLLWRKVRRGLSAGRVQSVALRLVVDREREIEAFKSEEYWSITARFEGTAPPPFQARLFQIDGRKVSIKTASEAEAIVNVIKDKTFKVSRVEKKKRKKTPAPPFITSTLQQESSRKLKFTAKKTMLIAQQLYEGLELGSEGSVGLITYMRTDSTRVAKEAQNEAKEYIIKEFGENFVPQKVPVYKSRKTAQEAHEAIRPTSVYRAPRDVKPFLSRDQYSLYKLIWKRFVASQMSPAVLEQTVADIIADNYLFRATGTVVVFSGFMSLYTESADEAVEEEGTLPLLKENDVLKTLELIPKQHFTQPPPRYTEATLVKELEAKGIGRPSTYATILSTIQERKYTEKLDGRFKPTELGMLVTDLLKERFPELMDVGFTAKMEEKLDRIEEGVSRWSNVVRDFYIPFERELNEAINNLGKVKPKDIPTEEICEKCGSKMVIKWGRHGRFLACTAFPECKNTMPIKAGKENNGQNKIEERTEETCDKCGSQMVIRSGRFGRFLACSRYPECKKTRPIGTGIHCPQDGGEIVERRSKKGKVFYSCSNYPYCKFATWYRPFSKRCPKCGADFLIEKRTKKEEVITCLNKGCGYKEPIQTEVTGQLVEE
jgi:DNA topoisomerase-1